MMKSKSKHIVELENKEQEPDFAALSSKLAIREPVPRKIRDVLQIFQNKIRYFFNQNFKEILFGQKINKQN